MEYALEERIGNPDLFTGRKEELTYFLEWLDNIKEKKSQSTALLARRKMGKTALMERLFNITFHKNDGVIPFYYEVKTFKSIEAKGAKNSSPLYNPFCGGTMSKYPPVPTWFDTSRQNPFVL